MRTLHVKDLPLVGGAKMLEAAEDGGVFCLPAEGGGFDLSSMADAKERYFIADIQVQEEHCLPFHFYVWPKDAAPGEDATFRLRFGLTPGIRLRVCIDLNWLNAETLFPEHAPLQHKVVCHGGRVERDNVGRITFTNRQCFHDVKVFFSDFTLSDEPPAEYPLPKVKLIDELGQYIPKEWPGKVKGLEDLKARLHAVLEGVPNAYPHDDWNRWGGWKKKRLTPGTGYFTAKKDGRRWYLVDPDGYAYICHGPTGVRILADARVDQVEDLLTYLPEETAENARMFKGRPMPWKIEGPWTPKHFSYIQSNMEKVFGKDWWPIWADILTRQIKSHGMNCLGIGCDPDFIEAAKIPYVSSLPKFPETETKIFRDFPDVFSDEYRRNAEASAQALADKAEDPYMIGYFLRNEPAWAFVDGLVIADEVLRNPEPTACRVHLIRDLREKYGSIQALNTAWGSNFASFDALMQPHADVSKWAPAASEDMHAFSRKMIAAYVGIPSKACRAVDPNHMILGMRWAWISDPDIVAGWENFDVFSINCYAFDPTVAIERVRELGVDLPVMIGEFHFGSLESGLLSTGLKAVTSQAERGVAYRHYVETGAAHPMGVSFQYFQCYDQFALGRFDGENYNIGLFDVCSQPYADMMRAIQEASAHIYPVAAGEETPYAREAQSIPVIGF